MAKDLECMRCGSENIVSGVKAGLDVYIVTPKHPGAWVSMMRQAPLLADVCGQCGHVELHIEDASSFVALARKARE